MSKGKLIVLEGLDGSGKATQAKLLKAHLKEQGFSVREITFPNYESDSSALVKMYLAGQFGQHPDDVNAYAASSFYAVDRYASYKKDWGSFYENGGIVIADRYTTSNAVHQCSKLPPEQWEEFLHWLFDYEFHLLGLPAPHFAHCPLLLASDGRRLSKRDGDQSLENLRAKYTAPEIIGKLAYAYGLQPEPAPRTPESLVPDFAWAKVPKQDICLPEGLF